MIKSFEESCTFEDDERVTPIIKGCMYALIDVAAQVDKQVFQAIQRNVDNEEELIQVKLTNLQ